MFDNLFPSKSGHNEFSLFEINEVIRRLGHMNEYEVIAEYPIIVDGRLRKIDWVWRDKKGFVKHAFEVEGVNVPKRSLEFDEVKFRALRQSQGQPKIKFWVATYSVRYFLQEGWQLLPANAAAQMRLENLPNWITWARDSELIEKLTQLYRFEKI